MLTVTTTCSDDNLLALNVSVQIDVSRSKTVINSNTTTCNPHVITDFNFNFGVKQNGFCTVTSGNEYSERRIKHLITTISHLCSLINLWMRVQRWVIETSTRYLTMNSLILLPCLRLDTKSPWSIPNELFSIQNFYPYRGPTYVITKLISFYKVSFYHRTPGNLNNSNK